MISLNIWSFVALRGTQQCNLIIWVDIPLALFWSLYWKFKIQNREFIFKLRILKNICFNRISIYIYIYIYIYNSLCVHIIYIYIIFCVHIQPNGDACHLCLYVLELCLKYNIICSVIYTDSRSSYLHVSAFVFTETHAGMHYQRIHSIYLYFLDIKHIFISRSTYVPVSASGIL